MSDKDKPKAAVRAPPLRQTVDELHVMNQTLQEIVVLLKILAEARRDKVN